MKTIIIENDAQLPQEVLNFLMKRKKEGLNSDDIDIQVACSLRSMEDLGRFISKADTVILKTSWANQSQFEEFVQGFANQKFGSQTFSFFIFEPLNELNEMLQIGEGHKVAEQFLNDLKGLVSSHHVYGFDSNGDYKKIILKNNKFDYELI